MIAAAFLTSAIGTDNNPEVGKIAPRIETINGENVVNDEDSERKTKVVSFWSPKNPASRITNRDLTLKYGEGLQEKVEFITICTDSDEVLMKEVMKADGIKPDKSYSYSGISPRVFKDYDVEDNPRTFIISPEGKITQII